MKWSYSFSIEQCCGLLQVLDDRNLYRFIFPFQLIVTNFEIIHDSRVIRKHARYLGFELD
jgi:hypothetical protein